MSKIDVRIDCLSEIFDEIGISATDEQLKKIVSDFSSYVEFESEMESNQHIGGQFECSKCKQLEAEIIRLNRDINIHKQSVMERRKTDNVWIENGSVMYGGR